MRLAPSDISYSQDSISDRFDSKSRHRNIHIGETLDDICNGRCSVENIPSIHVTKTNDKWVTADNRRLWVFKNLERLGKCETIPVLITYSIPCNKLTSYNGGTSVCVRGDPGGCWYQRPDPSKTRPPPTSGVAAFRSIGRSESTYDRGLVNRFRSVSLTGNRGSFMPNTSPSTFAVDTTSPQSDTSTFRSMNVTKTTRSTSSTVPQRSPNIFATDIFNNTQLNKTDRSLQYLSTPTEETSKSKSCLVCAIDFGTTYSGWAYSFRDDYKKDPTKAYVRQWHSGSSSLCTEKTPTIALIKPNGRTLLAFGYEAENEYKRLMKSNDHEQYYLFRRFKMNLYKKLGEGITRNILLKDELGKQLPAMDIFSMSIKFLADDLKRNVRQKLGGLIDQRDIDWVITVPAIWTDAAKQFMREAVTQAGISSDRLILALEPEAASLFCRHLGSDDIVGDDDVVLLRPYQGSKYLIFDAGGGTVDLTLHQVGTSDTLREVKPACGADCGGTMVDKAFEKLMIDIVGQDVYTQFRTTETDEFMDFQREFEFKKRDAGRSSRSRISIIIPSALMEIYHDETNRQLSDAVAICRYSDCIVLVRNNLRFDANFFASLFEESVTKALDQVNQILQKEDLKSIHAIYMVGGYSESPLLQKRMRDAYPTLNVVIPHDASMCVLKGALIYGHNPTAISERVLKYTYGTDISVPFDWNLHPIEKLIKYDEGSYCVDVFSIHAKQGQAVHIGTMQKRHSYISLQKHQQSVSIELYASDKESPVFVDEQGCRKIGETSIVFEKPYAMKYPRVTVCLTFSGTEIFVEAVEKASGQKIKCNMNFLG